MNSAESLADVVQRRLIDDRVADPLTNIESYVEASGPLLSKMEQVDLANEVRARVSGLGSLQPLADDPEVSEIMVNRGSDVWFERRGAIERSDIVVDAKEVEQLLKRLAAQANRQIDQSHPSVDVRLHDGSRLHGLLPPLAVDGPTLTLRRFIAQGRDIADFASAGVARYLADAVRDRATIVVAGGTSSGKTSLLNALSQSIPSGERIVTIEDAAELRLGAPHVVRLETRPARHAVPEVGMRELVRHSLRMRPDRIICGEMRGPEAFDLIQACNTGHEGSLTTIHANDPVAAMRRIETLMLLGCGDLPLRSIREQLASSIDLVVMLQRCADGRRRISQVAKVPSLSTLDPEQDWDLEPADGSDAFVPRSVGQIA